MITRTVLQKRLMVHIQGACITVLLCFASNLNAQVVLEQEIKVTDNALHFDGKRDTHVDFKDYTAEDFINDSQYHYRYGPNISAHGDAVKVYKHFVFMTWYRGGKTDRHVMLSRLNTKTNSIKTIKFPHRHTGLSGNWWIGESHNTIGLGVSPINGSIQMVYDMHGYSESSRRHKNDYFRYSYSVPGAAEVSDAEFTLDKFVKDSSNISQGNDDYKHLVMTGNLNDKDQSGNLTYPKFFITNNGTLMLFMRKGRDNNGAYVFNRYDAKQQKWSRFSDFSVNHQRDRGNAYNWGLYGNMKYVNGKLQVGFQQRTDIQDDKFSHQNGIFYAYSNSPDGLGQWYNHKAEPMTWPLVNSDEIKIYEPGNLVETTMTGKIFIAGNFDWTVTVKGDVHFIHRVRDNENRKTLFAHTYKPAGAKDFVTSTDFAGGESIYTSGNNVYIIGLKKGKPYIEVAPGGTNNFERVYEGTEGDFHHGVVHVEDGKVYYYLMKNATGMARPLYLQVIDLGIDSDPEAPPGRFSYAVPENAFLQVDRPVDIAFGAQDAFLYFTNRRTGVTCANSMCTKDPIPGVTKACFTREAKTTYGDTYHAIPGAIEAEHYDYGGHNVSYFDSDPDTNKSAEESDFRKNEGVDIVSENGNLAVGWISNGEWVEYSIFVHHDGEYSVSFISSSESIGGTVFIDLDGVTIESDIALPVTNDWSIFQETTTNISLTKGLHVLRLTFERGGFDLDKVIFKEQAK